MDAQLDQDLSGTWLGGIEGFDLGGYLAGCIVHGRFVLLGDLDVCGCHCDDELQGIECYLQIY